MNDSKTPDWADVAARALDVMPPEGPQLRSHRIAYISQALLSAYERGRAEREWQPIETAPKDGSEIILGGPGWSHAGFYSGEEHQMRRAEAGWFFEDDRANLLTARNADPIHWMHLPAPPAKENDNER